MQRVIDGQDKGFLYTRYGSNSSIVSLETKFASIELAEASMAFSSGMAAISAALISHGNNGIICIGDVYGGTWELMTSQLSLLDRKVVFVAVDDSQNLKKQLEQGFVMV